jgi:DNA helicase-2/ATP-dependent DNA helicase PcrA
VGGSRFDQMETFGSTYRTPGWQRARGNRGGEGGSGSSGGQGGSPRSGGSFRDAGASSSGASWNGATPRARAGGPMTIEGELVAKSTGAVSAFALGDRVFHQKFGNGNVIHVEGNKLTIAFDRAGEKKVVDSFVERV